MARSAGKSDTILDVLKCAAVYDDETGKFVIPANLIWIYSSLLKGPSVMPKYRARILGHDDHIRRQVDLVCDHQADAMAQAQRLVEGHDVELWDGLRKVARFFAKPQDPAKLFQGRSTRPPRSD